MAKDNIDPSKPSKEALAHLHSESDHIKNMEAATERKVQAEETKKKEAETKKAEKALAIKKTRKRKAASKHKLKEKKDLRTRIANITPDEINQLKRPAIDQKGLESDTLLVDTYESAELRLKSQGVKNITSTLFRYKALSQDEKAHEWSIPTWRNAGADILEYTPPPKSLYLEKTFPLNSDIEWFKYIETYKEELVIDPSRKNTDVLSKMMGLDLRPEFYDEQLPYFHLSTNTDYPARDLLYEYMQDLGLWERDVEYGLIGESYPPPTSGLTRDEFYHIQTHLENPGILPDNDPRKVWVTPSKDDIFYAIEEVKLAIKHKVSTKDKSSEAINLDKISQILHQAEELIEIRTNIQDMALVAFKAGREYEVNRNLAINMEATQHGESMTEGGNKKGQYVKEHTIIFAEIIADYENQSGKEKTTLKPVIAFIERSENKQWKEALLKGGQRSLESIINKCRTKKKAKK